MKILFFKRIGRLISILLIIMLLAACSEEREYTPQLPENTAMPPVLTDEGSTASFEAKLYFISEDGRKLYPEEQTIFYGTGVSRAEASIRGLIRGPVSGFLQPSIPKGLYLEHVELSLNVCNVYFTGEFPENMRAWLTARAAIAASVNDAEGIDKVNVFFNGIQPDYEEKALGTLSPVSDALDVYLKNMEQEYEVIPYENSSEAVAYETHTATLYFADASRSLIAAKTTELTYPSTATQADILRLIFGKLCAGDSGKDNLEPIMPADAELSEAPLFYYYGEKPESISGETDTAVNSPAPVSTAEPAASVTPDSPPVPQDGEKAYIADITIAYDGEYTQKDEYIMCAALTMTLTGYMPDLDGVRISVLRRDGAESLCETYFERTDFRNMIGHGITLFYPDAEGVTLGAVTRIVADTSAYDPKLRLSELLNGPADPGVMYAGFSAEDINDVYVADGVAVIDWKAGFADKLSDTSSGTDMPDGRRVRMFVYGVINTLTELPYVERVWMTEDGAKLGDIGGIYLGNPLVRSPGLISNE